MKILFCGDISPTSDNCHLFAQGDPAPLFSDVASLFPKADFSVVNLECALTESEAPIQKIGPAIKAPQQTAELFAKMGVTHCNLSKT